MRVEKIFLGAEAGYSNTSGDNNSFLGNLSGYSNTTGGYNSYVGRLAGFTNSIGDSCVFIGNAAGYWETGSDKLYIENSDAGSASALIYGDFNANILQFNANIGINGTPNAFYSLQVNYDADDIWALVVYGDTWCSSGIWGGSDLKLKKNIQNYSNALSKVNKLRGVSFEWRYEDFSSKGFREGVQIGMIAQEVEEVLPELVKEGPDGLKSINYSSISAVLVEAIKEQQKMIEELQERIAALEEENE
ncbi:MAG: tail fiber domain-containing protein [Bacteroidetes bacterium]|nr:tail fiber domain-containing protein [Bacteroidota bacterium]